jgi:hypothetical protein
MELGKLDKHMQKNESRPYLIPFTKINSRQTKDLNVRHEIIKLLEQNTAISTWALFFWVIPKIENRNRKVLWK